MLNLLGDVTAGEVKEYFEVSSYRNILDMLGALEGALKRCANYLYNKARILAAVKGGSPGGDSIKGAIGYANKKWPELQAQGKGALAHYYYAVDLLRDHFGFPAFWERSGFPPEKKPAIFDTYELLDLTRAINAEMNRVRLPMPHNFRQLASWINTRSDFDFQLVHKNRFGAMIEDSRRVINYYEMIRIIADGMKAVKEMRQEVRKEIDAARLAPQVEEGSIRREDEALISREQADREAAAREESIRAAKAREYRADYDLLLARLDAAGSRDEQLRILGQLETVVAAINGLQADSVGRVSVPAVELLPSAEELQRVAQAIADDTARQQAEIAGQVDQAIAAHDSLVDAANSAQTDQEAAGLEQQVDAHKRTIEQLQAELAKLDTRAQSAKAAKDAAADGDLPTAETKLIEAAGRPGVGAVLPVLGVLLLALSS